MDTPRFSPPGSRPERPSPTRSRPIGVTLLTIYDGVLLGGLPFVLGMLRFFSLPVAERPTVLVVFATMLLSGFVIGSAASAWRGETQGRLGLVVAATIYYTGVFLGAPYAVDLASEIHPGGAFETWTRLLRSVFWIGLHGWYLLFSGARDFFEPTA